MCRAGDTSSDELLIQMHLDSMGRWQCKQEQVQVLSLDRGSRLVSTGLTSLRLIGVSSVPAIG